MKILSNIRRKNNLNSVKRRISTELEEPTRLKTTGLDLLDASNDNNAVSTSSPKDHDDECTTQMKDRGHAIINFNQKRKIRNL